MPPWKLYDQFTFIRALEQRLTDAGYHTLLYSLGTDHPSLNIIVERKLEAVFLIDVHDESFYSISKHFVEGIPLILIDSMIEDKLFKQVLYNYRSALQKVMPEDLSQVCLIMRASITPYSLALSKTIFLYLRKQYSKFKIWRN